MLRQRWTASDLFAGRGAVNRRETRPRARYPALGLAPESKQDKTPFEGPYQLHTVRKYGHVALANHNAMISTHVH